LWDNKEGRLRGDRPHMLKVYGYYQLPWNATLGAFAVAQSGQAWESWSSEPYRALTANTSTLIRYAEPAGSRRTPSHYQVDLKYMQDFQLPGRPSLQLIADLYNITDKQTGYNFEPSVTVPTFNTPRHYFDPRRLNLTVRLLF